MADGGAMVPGRRLPEQGEVRIGSVDLPAGELYDLETSFLD